MHKANGFGLSRPAAWAGCAPVAGNGLVRHVSGSSVLARDLFPEVSGIVLKLPSPRNIYVVCIWSLMVTGYFSLFAPFNRRRDAKAPFHVL